MNTRKKTHEEYVAEVAKINPNIEVMNKYINAKTPILHRCKIDGYEWLARPNDILCGKGCLVCGQIKKAKSKTKTNEKYIAEVAKINSNIEVVEPYMNSRVKTLHRCKVCGYEWFATPDNILRGCGCPKCANNTKRTHKEYVEELARVNPNIEVVGIYINAVTKILHRCKKCGYEWLVSPNALLSGHGCPKCSKVLKPTQQEYIEKVRIINDEIEVLGEYISRSTKISHRCKRCGYIWNVTPGHIFEGRKCPKCGCSYGERSIDRYLTKHNIAFIFQHKFENCRNKYPLPFDFYLPDYNACIEYDGIQHFEPIEIFGGKEALEYTRKNDEIKNRYCKSNNIILLRIKYNEDIESVLNIFLQNIKRGEMNVSNI